MNITRQKVAGFQIANMPIFVWSAEEVMPRLNVIKRFPYFVNSETQRISGLGVTPVKYAALKEELYGYDRNLSQFLLDGFKYGFSLCYTGPRSAQTCKNLKSAYQNPSIVWEKINKEIAAGRVAGPFSSVPFQNFKMSPIGMVPKREPGEYRLIHHLSYPPGESLNDNIDPALCSVHYTNLAIDETPKFDCILRNCRRFSSQWTYELPTNQTSEMNLDYVIIQLIKAKLFFFFFFFLGGRGESTMIPVIIQLHL